MPNKKSKEILTRSPGKTSIEYSSDAHERGLHANLSRKRIFLLSGAALLFCFQCFSFVAWMIRPSHEFDEEQHPPTPDYAQDRYWAARPDQNDLADFIPEDSNLVDGQSDSEVDVFFVHPTSYLSDESWNANAAEYSTRISQQDVVQQSSVFNGSARVFAPRYRQATMGTFAYLNEENSRRALDLAYKDIREAFQFYLRNYNDGRPFILAGHSQGAFLVVRLMQDFLDVTEASRDSRFIIAYAPGAGIKPDQFQKLKSCTSPEQTSCYVSWNSRLWGVEIQGPDDLNAGLKGTVCINPITWKPGEDIASAHQHQGSMRKDFLRIDRQFIEARCKNSLLWVKASEIERYQSDFQKENLHPMDFNLFYLDVRKNVDVRIRRHRERYPALYGR